MAASEEYDTGKIKIKTIRYNTKIERFFYRTPPDDSLFHFNIETFLYVYFFCLYRKVELIKFGW